MDTAPDITTERLLLRAHRLDDFNRIADLYATERSRYIGGPLAEKAVWLGFMSVIGQWPIMGYGGWAIDLKESGDYIGQVALGFPVEFPEPELGWLLSPAMKVTAMPSRRRAG